MSNVGSLPGVSSLRLVQAGFFSLSLSWSRPSVPVQGYKLTYGPRGQKLLLFLSFSPPSPMFSKVEPVLSHKREEGSQKIRRKVFFTNVNNAKQVSGKLQTCWECQAARTLWGNIIFSEALLPSGPCCHCDFYCSAFIYKNPTLEIRRGKPLLMYFE